jgi:hypothetical protein
MDRFDREASTGATLDHDVSAEQPHAVALAPWPQPPLVREAPNPGDHPNISRPNISRAWAYWDAIRAGRPMPSRADLDPAAIKPLLSYLLLIDVLREPLDFRFRLVGTEIARIVAGPYTGVRFSELPHMRRGNTVWAEYERVAAGGTPLCAEIDYVGAADHVRRMAHALFPLSGDGRTVNMIFAVVDIERRW